MALGTQWPPHRVFSLLNKSEKAPTVKELPFPGGPIPSPPPAHLSRKPPRTTLRSESSGCNPFACSHPGKHHPSGDLSVAQPKKQSLPPRSSPPDSHWHLQALFLRVASREPRASRPAPNLPARNSARRRPPLPAPTPPARCLRRPRRPAPSSRAPPAGRSGFGCVPSATWAARRPGGELEAGGRAGARHLPADQRARDRRPPARGGGLLRGHPPRAWLTQPTWAGLRG